MENSLVVGIDPGTSGAIALVDSRGRVSTYDIPCHKVKRGKTVKLRLDNVRLQALANALTAVGPVCVFVEDVGGLPGQSAPAAFTFGATCGAIAQAFIAAGAAIEPVTPQVWKKRLGVPKDKDSARAVASRLLPAGAHLWPLVKHDGRAEAALIALWGLRFGILAQESPPHGVRRAF